MEITEKEEKRSLANPTKFGLAGLAIALFMLGLAYAEVIAMSSVVIATIFTMGFIAPVTAGILEFVKGNSYRATTLMLFGLFFLTFYIFSTRPLNCIAPTRNTLGVFYIAWAITAAKMLCGIVAKKMGRKNILLMVILALFTLFLIMIAVSHFADVRALFIASGVLALLTAAAIYVDFMIHIVTRIRKDMQNK